MRSEANRISPTLIFLLTLIPVLVPCVAVRADAESMISGIAADRESIPLPPTAAKENLLGRLPATYMGTLPCADCAGIDVQLNLSANATFILRTVFRDRTDGTFDDFGNWSIGSDGSTLVLLGGREAPIYFAVIDDSTLRKLDLDANEIESEVDHDLSRHSEFVLVEPHLHLQGTFRYFADAALFQECLTGRKLPVAQEGDYLALERAYLEADGEPGAPMLANLDGGIVLRPPMEGEGMRPTLVVDRFVGVRPGEECGPRPLGVELVGPRWELVKLGDEAVMFPEDRDEIHIVFAAEDSRAHGFAGCNSFQGGYEADGEKLTFGPAAMTMMACIDGMEEEQGFVTAMHETATWRILGRMLEFFDADGTAVARFTATESSD